MSKFKNKYRIESNRWRYWDYSAPGQYFLTVCIQDRECILGNVVDRAMKFSPSGEIVESEIKKIPTYHKRIILDEWIVMPNHIHLIIELEDYNYDNGMWDGADGADDTQQWWHIPNYQPTLDEIKQYRKFRRKMIIPKIMGKLKMVTSKNINIANNSPGTKNWQKDYHDHIIRNDTSYQNIANYIITNPQKWTEDKFYNNKNE